MKRAYILIGIIVVAALVLVLVFHRKRAESTLDTLEGYQKPANIAIGERLEKQISHLRTQSEIETLQTLDKMEFYEWPGAFIGVETPFMLDAYGNVVAESFYERNRVDLEKVLSNRVFRKSLQDIGKLPKNQASEMLANELDVALSRYLELFNGFYESLSTSITDGESADGRPVLRGFRNKLFALILIAGSLELTGLHEKIKQIDSIAKDQKTKVSRIKDPQIRMHYTLLTLLHNNIVLASGLYGTSPRKGDAELKPFADRFSDHKMVDFSAPATEYDTPVRHGVQTPTPDKGNINVRYFDQVTDEDLNVLRTILNSPDTEKQHSDDHIVDDVS